MVVLNDRGEGTVGVGFYLFAFGVDRRGHILNKGHTLPRNLSYGVRPCHLGGRLRRIRRKIERSTRPCGMPSRISSGEMSLVEEFFHQSRRFRRQPDESFWWSSRARSCSSAGISSIVGTRRRGPRSIFLISSTSRRVKPTRPAAPTIVCRPLITIEEHKNVDRPKNSNDLGASPPKHSRRLCPTRLPNG